MKLIPDWKAAWKFSSVQITVAVAVLNASAGAWSAFSGHVDPILWASINAGLAIAVAVARVVDQDV